MAKKQDLIEAIEHCLEIGYTKEDLQEKLLIKGQEHKVFRLKQIITDFLFGEVKKQNEYSKLFSVSTSTIGADFQTIIRKARWLIRYYETEQYWKGVEKDQEEKERLTTYHIHGPLDTRTLNALYHAGFKNAKDVYNFDFENNRVRNLGRTCFERIEKFKKEYEKVHN